MMSRDGREGKTAVACRPDAQRAGRAGEVRKHVELFMTRLETSPQLLKDTWALKNQSGNHKHGK